MGTKKKFVLDTNVILHDCNCLDNFQENDVYIPIIVLEELDKFKKGSEQINFNAREFVRKLDEITTDKLFTEGVSLGKGMGNLFVLVGNTLSRRVEAAFNTRIPDHQILSETILLSEKYPETRTILVTKDVNLRMKARSLGVKTEDYTTDKIKNFDIFGAQHIEINTDDETVSAIYGSKGVFPWENLKQKGALPLPHQCMIINAPNSSVLACYDSNTRSIKRITKQKYYGIEPRNAEQTFTMEMLNNPDISLLAITGKAGTGKTLLALAAALSQHDNYNQILLARPIVALANKDLGFLPGDEKEKIAPYMQPLFDNLAVIKHQFAMGGSELREIQEMQNSGQLVLEALAYIRGRSLSDTFCIIDEAQNLTPHEVKTIITRAGEGTKMVFTGDIQQIDSPYLDAQSNGLAYMIDHMRGEDIFAHVNLMKGERSLLSEIAGNKL